MGWNSQVVIAQQVIIEGTEDGLFVYNGPAAAGNLIASVAAADGQDQYDNLVWNGVTVYTGNGLFDQFLSLRTNGLFFGTNQNGAGGTGALAAEAPVTMRILRRLVATDPASETLDETWHSLAAGNGWSGTVFYRLTPENETQLHASLTSPGSGVNGVPIVTVPAAYRPQNIPMPFNTTHTGTTNFEEKMILGTDGTLQASGVGTGASVVINERVPLDVP